MEEVFVTENSHNDLWKEAHESLLKSIDYPINIRKSHPNKVGPTNIIMGDTEKEMSKMFYDTPSLTPKKIQIMNCGVVRNGKYKIIPSSNAYCPSVNPPVSLLKTNNTKEQGICEDSDNLNSNSSKANGVNLELDYNKSKTPMNVDAEKEQCNISEMPVIDLTKNEPSLSEVVQNNPIILPMKSECVEEHEEDSSLKTSAEPEIKWLQEQTSQNSYQYKCEAQLKFEMFTPNKYFNNDISGSKEPELNIEKDSPPINPETAIDSTVSFAQSDFRNVFSSDDSVESTNYVDEAICSTNDKQIMQCDQDNPIVENGQECQGTIITNDCSEESYQPNDSVLHKTVNVYKVPRKIRGSSSKQNYFGSGNPIQNDESVEIVQVQGLLNNHLVMETSTDLLTPPSQIEITHSKESHPENTLSSNETEKLSIDVNSSVSDFELESPELGRYYNLSFTDILNGKPNVNEIHESVGFSYIDPDDDRLNKDGKRTLFSNFGSFKFTQTPVPHFSGTSKKIPDTQSSSQNVNFIFTDSKVFLKPLLEDFSVDSSGSEKEQNAREILDSDDSSKGLKTDSSENFLGFEESNSGNYCKPNETFLSNDFDNINKEGTSFDIHEIDDLQCDIEFDIVSLNSVLPNGDKDLIIAQIISKMIASKKYGCSFTKHLGKLSCIDISEIEKQLRNCDMNLSMFSDSQTLEADKRVAFDKFSRCENLEVPLEHKGSGDPQSSAEVKSTNKQTSAENISVVEESTPSTTPTLSPNSVFLGSLNNPSSAEIEEIICGKLANSRNPEISLSYDFKESSQVIIKSEKTSPSCRENDNTFSDDCACAGDITPERSPFPGFEIPNTSEEQNISVNHDEILVLSSSEENSISADGTNTYIFKDVKQNKIVGDKKLIQDSSNKIKTTSKFEHLLAEDEIKKEVDDVYQYCNGVNACPQYVNNDNFQNTIRNFSDELERQYYPSTSRMVDSVVSAYREVEINMAYDESDNDGINLNGNDTNDSDMFQQQNSLVRVSTGKEERETIDDMDLVTFLTEYDMNEYTDLEEAVNGSQKGRPFRKIKPIIPIVPTKTDDITKIKGWRNKKFLKKNSSATKGGICHNSESKTKSDKKMNKPSVKRLEKNLQGQLDTFYVKKLAEDPVLRDLQKKVNESKGSKASVFESSILEEYLQNNSVLNISYEVPKLSAADAFPKIENNSIFEDSKSPGTKINKSGIQMKGDIIKNYKPKTLAEKRVMMEIAMLESEATDIKPFENIKEKTICSKDNRKSRKTSKSNFLVKPKFDFNPNHRYMWVQGRPIRVAGNIQEWKKKKKFPGIELGIMEDVPDFRKPLILRNTSNARDSKLYPIPKTEIKQEIQEDNMAEEKIAPSNMVENLIPKTEIKIEANYLDYPGTSKDFEMQDTNLIPQLNTKPKEEASSSHYSLIPSNQVEPSTKKDTLEISDNSNSFNIPFINRCPTGSCTRKDNLCKVSKNFSLGMVLNIGVNRPLSEKALKNLSLLEQSDNVIDERMAYIASSAVQTSQSAKSKKFIVTRCVVPVLSEEPISIAEESLKKCVNPVSQYDVTPFLKRIDEFGITNSSVEPDPEVRSVVNDLVDYVERKFSFGPLPLDPDAPKAKGDQKVRKRKSRDKSGPTSHVERELKKLINVSIIDLAASGDDQENHCTKEFCSKGCVCSSLEGKLPINHCRKEQCIFGCICPNKFNESEKYIVYNNSEKQQLAKEEKTWHQTVIRKKNKDIQVMVGSDRIKREKKLPQRYRNHVVMYGKELINAEPTPIKSEDIRPRRENTRSLRKRIPQKPIENEEEVIISNPDPAPIVEVKEEKPEPPTEKLNSKLPKTPLKKEDSIKRNSMDRILSFCSPDPGKDRRKSLADVLVWCMNHSVYNCLCNSWVCDLRSNIILWKPSRKFKYLNLKEMSKIILKTYDGVGRAQIYDFNRYCARTFGAPINYAARNKTRVFATKRRWEIDSSFLSTSNGYYRLGNQFKECVTAFKDEILNLADDSIWSLVGLCEEKLEEMTDIIPEKDMQDLSVRLRLISTSLPVVHFDSRWWVIELENNFDYFLISTDSGSTSYGMIAETVRHAQTRQSTVCLPILWRKDHKYGNQFGAYAISKLSNVICLGPYALNENHMVIAYRNIKGKVFNVPFTNSYKTASNPRMHIKGYWCYIKPRGDSSAGSSKAFSEPKNHKPNNLLQTKQDSSQSTNESDIECVVIEDSEDEKNPIEIKTNSKPKSQKNKVVTALQDRIFQISQEIQLDALTRSANTRKSLKHYKGKRNKNIQSIQGCSFSHRGKRKRTESVDAKHSRRKAKDERSILNLISNHIVSNGPPTPSSESDDMSVEILTSPVDDSLDSSKYGLLCLTAGIGYLPISEYTSSKLIVQDPMGEELYHNFKNLNDASIWLNSFLRQRMTFEPEKLKLEWLIVKPGIWKFTSTFNPKILQKAYIVRKEGVSKIGSSDDEESPSEKISRFSKTSLLALVNQYLDKTVQLAPKDSNDESTQKVDVPKKVSINAKKTINRKNFNISKEIKAITIKEIGPGRYAKVITPKSLLIQEHGNGYQPEVKSRQVRMQDECLPKSKPEDILKKNPEHSISQMKKPTKPKKTQSKTCRVGKSLEKTGTKQKSSSPNKRRISEVSDGKKGEVSDSGTVKDKKMKKGKKNEVCTILDEKTGFIGTVTKSQDKAIKKSSKKVMVTLEMVIPDKAPEGGNIEKGLDKQNKIGSTWKQSTDNGKIDNSNRTSAVCDRVKMTVRPKMVPVDKVFDRKVFLNNGKLFNRPFSLKSAKADVDAANNYVNSLFTKKCNKNSQPILTKLDENVQKNRSLPTKVLTSESSQNNGNSNSICSTSSKKVSPVKVKGKLAGDVFLGDKKLFTIPLIKVESKLVPFQ